MPTLQHTAGEIDLQEAQILPSQLAARFEVLELLGEGTQARVWKAYDLRYERFVALKIARNQAEGQLLLREADFLRQGAGPGIPICWDVCEAAEAVVLVLELIEGTSLQEFIDSPRPLSSVHVLDWLTQLVRLLERCHDRGFLHGDLKPQNILIDSEDRLWLTDFGLARILSDRHPVQGLSTLAGSPRYLPPELIAGEVTHLDPVGEIYSLGVVLHQLLAGEVPNPGTIADVICFARSRESHAPLPRDARFPLSLTKLCNRLLARNPHQRPNTPTAIRAMLQAASREAA